MQSEHQFDDFSITKLVERMKRDLVEEPESISETNKDSPGTLTNFREMNDDFSSRQRKFTATTYATRSSSDARNSSSYQFNGRMMGYAIFIINSKFDSQNERKYAYLDCKKMKDLFEQLGFEIKILENKSTKELLHDLEDIRNSIEMGHDCMACVISSHGCEIRTHSNERQHVIFTKDSTVFTEDILHNFSDDKCDSLIGKPKMFFIQACRCDTGAPEITHYDKGFDLPDKNTKCLNSYNGVSSTKVIDQESVFQIPCNEDYLVMFTCSSGRVGITDERKGGWLMYCLFHVFNELLQTNYEQNVLQILTKVCGKIAQELQVNCLDDSLFHGTKAAAVIYHMLTKDLYLKPKRFRYVMRPTSMEETFV